MLNNSLPFVLILAVSASAAAAWLLGWFLTSVVTLPIRVKPFNCRECLTFWLTFLGGTALSVNVAPDSYHAVYLVAISLCYATIFYLLLTSKFTIYE